MSVLQVLRNTFFGGEHHSTNDAAVRYYDHDGQLLGWTTEKAHYNSDGRLIGITNDDGSISNATGVLIAQQDGNFYRDIHGYIVGERLLDGTLVDEDGLPTNILEMAGLIQPTMPQDLFISESAGSWGSAGSHGSEVMYEDEDEADYESEWGKFGEFE